MPYKTTPLKKSFDKILLLSVEEKKEFQRLEFLGDRVLGLSIAEDLLIKFGNYDEGKLAKLYAYLTSKKVLVIVARSIGLLDFLKQKNIDNISDKILSDYMEALIGLMFLDKGFNLTRNNILLLWNLEIINEYDLKDDYKTSLQEWSQSKKLGLPKYILTKKDGPDHKPIFKVKVEIKTYVSTEGKGSTLQIAEQNAAKVFLKSNKFSDEN